ncbi:S9 family peptidase [Sporichthya polymorpha]|uniref:S9 family peptidase n=1 Tax=Sporichthya polymorpha TaxID=35751 RepID=UPI0003635F32|nr:S9 family peptidase [Sporichthya polymorpha]
MIVRAPYGSWSTPITSELLLSAAVQLREVRVDDDTGVVWAEGRPAEGGRTQLVRLDAAGNRTDLLPDGFNARTGVHEYGGGSWWVRDGVVWFVNWVDQRLYRLEPGGEPQPLTEEPAVPRGDRWADGEISPDGEWIVCVREQHAAEGGAAAVRNEIVRLAAHAPSTPEILATGTDFVSSPRLSPDGRTLAYVRWNHPSMPWDDTELVRLDLDSGAETVVAGGPGESVGEPRWTEDGRLLFLSDRTDWWNLYCAEPDGTVASVVEIDAEIGWPAWMFGAARYAVLADGTVVFARVRGGYDGLALRLTDGQIVDLDLPFSIYSDLRLAGPSSVVVVAGSPTSEQIVARIDLTDGKPVVTELRAPRALGLDPALISLPEHVSFPSRGVDGSARTAHALYYPPTNPAFEAAAGERPPLLVVIHGGPTAAAIPVLQLGLQFWTSRGFAVVDVNYGGSTGYGRPYRDLLKDAWGVIDVEDCLAAARWLAESDRADPDRLCIRGGSAGGFTTLAALVREDTPFAAGADHFGVSDLAALAAETHKFESRYLDGLVGPYPEAAEIYRERSPISQVEKFRKPLIVLQGSEDAVVPPAQSEVIVDALRTRGVPVAYLLFEGEQHGFRRAENIRRAVESELSFYAQVFGFDLPEEEGIDPVLIENLAG